MLRQASVVMLLAGVAAFAQRPSNPALMVPQETAALDFASVPNWLGLPDGTTMGPPAATAFDSKGHLFVLNRGPQALMEFDATGKFIRAFGDGLFRRTHGFRIDRDDNMWITDVGAHIVVKMNPQGQVLMTL